MARILILEDDPIWGSLIKDNLSGDFQFDDAGNIQKVQLLLKTNTYDLIIADLLLTDREINFFNLFDDISQLIFAIKQRQSQGKLRPPIIVITVYPIGSQILELLNFWPGWIWGWHEKEQFNKSKFLRNVETALETRKTDEARGDKVQRNKVGGIRIGDVSGGIHGSVIAGHNASDVNLSRKTSDQQENPVAQSPALQALRMILSSLYDTETDARRIAQESGLDTRQVNFSTKSVNFWHHVLVEAHNQDKVKAIVSIANFEYPAKAEALRQAYQECARSH